MVSNEKLDGIIRRLAEGSNEAKRVFYEETAKLLQAISRSYLKDQDVSDAVHDFMIGAHIKAKRYRTNTNPRAWLIKTYSNFLKNRIKKNQKYRCELLTENICATRAEDDIENADRRADVFLIMRGLKAYDRYLLISYHWGGLSYAEIGMQLHKPKSTIQSQLERIHKNLRKKELNLRTKDEF